MKSLAMLNLSRISPSADFYSKITALELQVSIINKNVLYCTHELDKIYKVLMTLVADQGVQHQVDDYFEKDAEEKAEQV